MIDFLISILWFVIGLFFASVLFNQIRQILFWFPKILILYLKKRIRITAILFFLATSIVMLSVIFFVTWLIQGFILANFSAFISGCILSVISKCYIDLFKDEFKLKNKADFLRFSIPHSKDGLNDLVGDFVVKFSRFVMKNNLRDDRKRNSVGKVVKYCPDLLKPRLSEIKNELFKLRIDKSDWVDLRFAIEYNFFTKHSSAANYQEIVEEIAQLYIKSFENMGVKTHAETDWESMEDWAAKNRLYADKIPFFWQRVEVELVKQGASDEVLLLWKEGQDMYMNTTILFENMTQK